VQLDAKSHKKRGKKVTKTEEHNFYSKKFDQLPKTGLLQKLTIFARRLA
jgi:hypothetical protein